MPIKQLVSFERALEHLRVNAGEDDAFVRDLIDAASDIIIDYLKMPVPDDWAIEDGNTPSTVPGRVRSAVLLVLGSLYADREGTTDPLSPAVESLLMRSRKPAVA